MSLINTILPPAADTLKKSEEALMSIKNIIAWSGVVDIINNAAARGLKEVEYRYIDFDVFREEGALQARTRFVGELCRAGYEVRYASSCSMIISWEHANSHRGENEEEH